MSEYNAIALIKDNYHEGFGSWGHKPSEGESSCFRIGMTVRKYTTQQYFWRLLRRPARAELQPCLEQTNHYPSY